MRPGVAPDKTRLVPHRTVPYRTGTADEQAHGAPVPDLPLIVAHEI